MLSIRFVVTATRPSAVARSAMFPFLYFMYVAYRVNEVYFLCELELINVEQQSGN